ncbi:D-aspartate oxidase [Chionoecetes opilio]|uniref:D-aspartate oxidase n=1 Tax=Chionoecetes opilio TaxID=41210 RepID=A0A8J4YSY6_CHIOP|nr:D-aspartate oxidase [Chionoecetes opilio]
MMSDCTSVSDSESVAVTDLEYDAQSDTERNDAGRVYYEENEPQIVMGSYMFEPEYEVDEQVLAEPEVTGQRDCGNLIVKARVTLLTVRFLNGLGSHGNSSVNGTVRVKVRPAGCPDSWDNLNSVLEPPPSWQHIPLGYASLTPDQCAQFGPRYKSGFRFTTFTAEPSKLLPSLLRDLKALGTRLEVRCLSSLKEAADEADLVINCSGLGARDLVPDPFVFPVRGQVIRSAEVVEEWVGLRPYRSKGVRLEADELQLGNRTIPVVHNYGHGGCGVTLFWGCSQEVARLASRLILRHHGPASKL